VCYVDADPTSLQLLRGGDRRSAAAEWIADYVAVLAARVDDTFE